MNRDHTEENWVHGTGNVDERWGNLSDCQLTDMVQDTYGLTNGDEDARGQPTDWQQRLSEIERAAQ